jgi:hypothetical protein
MPNPTLDQIWHAILLENGNSPVSERVSCSDRDSDLLAEQLQKVAIHVPIDQRSSVAALKTRPDVRSPKYDLTIAIAFASTSTSHVRFGRHDSPHHT